MPIESPDRGKTAGDNPNFYGLLREKKEISRLVQQKIDINLDSTIPYFRENLFYIQHYKKSIEENLAGILSRLDNINSFFIGDLSIITGPLALSEALMSILDKEKLIYRYYFNALKNFQSFNRVFNLIEDRKKYIPSYLFDKISHEYNQILDLYNLLETNFRVIQESIVNLDLKIDSMNNNILSQVNFSKKNLLFDVVKSYFLEKYDFYSKSNIPKLQNLAGDYKSIYERFLGKQNQ